MDPGRAVLLFDDGCPVCRRAADWVARHGVPGAFELLPCASEDAARRFPSIAANDCLRAMQLVLPDGAVFSGERALPEILRRTRRYAWAAPMFGLPGAGVLSRVIYRWFAGRRHAISSFFFPGPPRS